MITVLYEKLVAVDFSPEWVEIDESDVKYALADFPVDWPGLTDRATPDGIVLHTPAGRFRIRVVSPGTLTTD